MLCVCVRLQVGLGDCNELLDADYEASNLPPGKHSTKGLGQTGPDPKNAVTLLVPLITLIHIIQAEHRFNCAHCYTTKIITTSERGVC